jgi:cytochrome c oxidase subunit 3
MSDDNLQASYLSTEEKQIKASKNLLWIGIISIIMLFGGFTSAYIVSKGGSFWVNINLPVQFLISTVFVIAGSLALILAVNATKKNHRQHIKSYLLLAFVSGLAFSVSQYIAWKQLMARGCFFTDTIMDRENPDKFFVKGEYGKDFTLSFNNRELIYENGKLYFDTGEELLKEHYDKLKLYRNTASSFIYLLTFMHLLHLLGGMIYLSVILIKSFRNTLNNQNYLKINLLATYWHFLGLLWIFLYVFLQFIH